MKLWDLATFATGRLVTAAVLLLLPCSHALAGACNVAAPAAGIGPARLSLDDVPASFPEIDAKLAKGLTVTIVHEVTLPGRPALIFGCRVYYDLWDESYGVTTFSGGSGQAHHSERDKGKAQALCDQTTLDAPLAGIASLDVITHLDPVSDDQLEKTRQWLASRGIGTASKAIVGRAVGAMINLKEETSVSRACRVERP